MPDINFLAKTFTLPQNIKIALSALSREYENDLQEIQARETARNYMEAALVQAEIYFLDFKKKEKTDPCGQTL